MRRKRKNAYVTSGSTEDSLERISKKFSSDIRKQVKKINPDCDLFSKNFLNEVDLIEHIAKIGKIESKPHFLLNEETTNLPSYQEKSKTLWEREEHCLRFLVEEGKVNVLIQKMVAFKKIQYEIRSKNNLIQLLNSSAIKGIDPLLFERRLSVFEANLGILLLCLFTSIEAIKSVEFQQLFDYIEFVVKHASGDDFDGSNQKLITNFFEKQEFVVISILHLLLRQIQITDDESMEEKIMKLLLPRGMMNLLVQYFSKFEKILGNNEKVYLFGCLSYFCDSEEFKTFSNRYLDHDHTSIMLSYYDSCVKPLVKMSPRNRKILRSLNDFIIRSKLRGL